MATNAAKPRAPSRRSRRPTKKQWIERGVLYTTLIGSLLTAGPQWIDQLKAVAQGIESGSAKAAKRQNELWRKNFACAAAPYAWYSNPSNVKIDATICDSGDLLVRANTPDNREYFQWLALSDVLKSGGGGGGLFPAALISAAHAASIPERSSSAPPAPLQGVRLAQPHAIVLCQKFIDDRRLLRRVQTPQGCFDEVVDTFNGTVVSRKAAPCTRQC